MQVVQPPVLRRRLDVAETLGFFVIKLGLVHDLESRGLHPDKVFPAEFPVMADLPNAESLVPHFHKPVHNVGVVDSRGVAQRQPPVVRPAEQRYVVLVGFDVRRHHREKGMGNDDVRAFVVAKQRRRRQVMELREVGPAVPVNGHLRKLVNRPVILAVRPPKFVDVEICFHGVGVDIQGLGEKILPLLGIVLCLEGIIQNLGWSDGYSIIRICHLVDLRVCKIYTPILHTFWGTAHEDEILLILYCAVQDLTAVFQALPKKSLLIISRGGNANQQFVRVCLLRFLEQVVLLGLFKRMDFIDYTDISI